MTTARHTTSAVPRTTRRRPPARDERQQRPPAAGVLGSPLCWVLDPDDDVACMQAMYRLHDLAAGIVVCHPRPTATWPVLIADVLTALGKHPRALTRERRTADGAALLRLWLHAERITHLVVLRAHRLGVEVLALLAELAADVGCTLWLVWHHHGRPPLPGQRLSWDAAIGRLRATPGSHHCRVPDDNVYGDPVAAARYEARTWRPDGHRLGWKIPYYEHAWPGCDIGALLQRLTIDVATPTELYGRLRAAQHTFAAEGRTLALPDLDMAELAVLGPRLAPDTIDRLRLLVCPVTAAALMLALATDIDAVELRPQRADRNPDHDLHQISLIAGRYRIPERARPLWRAALLGHRQPMAGQPLFAPSGSHWVSAQRLAHMIGRGAALTGIAPPKGARPLYGHRPASPFAPAFTSGASVTDR